MKRIGNLYSRICSLENLHLADQRARKVKKNRYGVQDYMQNWEANLYSLNHRLVTRTFKVSPYTTFTIFEPKERLIFRLPYYPDGIVQYAILNVVESIFRACFTADTYSCIKGRGIHGAVRNVKAALKDQTGTRYCLKLDIRKFYPSIDHDILKGLLRRKFKDPGLLWLFDVIIDSAPGIPIGNYLSQYFANFYLTYFDHWLKEVKGVKYYFRYADDLVILSPDKPSLHALLGDIREYLGQQLHLDVKDNYQVFPIGTREKGRGIDFVGYVFYHTHVKLRPEIKRRFARMLANRPNLRSIVSYRGWTSHCNSRHLMNKFRRKYALPGL